MNGEIQAQIDRLATLVGQQFEALGAQVREGFRAGNERLDRLETRMDALEGRVTDGFLAVADRFATMQIQLDQVDARVTASLEKHEHRITSLWSEVRDRQAAAEDRLNVLTLAVQSHGKTVELLRERVEGASVLMEKHTIGVVERTGAFRSAVVQRLDDFSRDLLSRLEAVEKQLVRLYERMDGLSADMLQRFRVVNDRLGEIDKRLAA